MGTSIALTSKGLWSGEVAFRRRAAVLAVHLLLLGCLTARAAVTTTGDVHPNPATATPSTTLFVADAADGTMTVDGGSDVTARDTFVGYENGATGAVTVDGPGSTLANTYHMVVGYSGAGELAVTGGGLVTNEYAFVAREELSRGKVTLSGAGSEWAMDSFLQLANNGDAILRIEQGAVLRADSCSAAYDPINSTANITISGAGSQLALDEHLRLGYYGDAEMLVEAGGSASGSRGTFQMASRDTSTAVATVTGPGSTLQFASTYVGVYGHAELTIADGATATSPGGWSVGFLSSAQGTLTVTGNNSSLTSHGICNVGSQGRGDVVVSDGAYLSSGYTTVGGAASAQANVTVTGAGSRWDTVGYFTVGVGEVWVTDGGVLTGDESTIDSAGLGGGTVTISGAGSRWTSSDFLSVENGTLTIDDGGTVTSNESVAGGGATSANQSSVGQSASAQVIVRGAGSTWTDPGWLDLGHGGEGHLIVEQGATVEFGEGAILGFGPGTGVISVDGPGSTCRLAGATLGFFGSASFVMADGGIIDVTGDVACAIANGSASLEYVIGPNGVGRLIVANDIDLQSVSGGTAQLDVSADPSFMFAQGQSFDLMDWGGSLHGQFDTIMLADLPVGLAWDTSLLYTDGSVSIVPEPGCASLAVLGGLVFLRRKRA